MLPLKDKTYLFFFSSRKRNERFFLAGRRLIHLIENHTTQVAEAIRKSNKRGTSRRQLEALEQLTAEAKHLRQTLLSVSDHPRVGFSFMLLVIWKPPRHAVTHLSLTAHFFYSLPLVSLTHRHLPDPACRKHSIGP